MKPTYYGHTSFLIEIQGKKQCFNQFIQSYELVNELAEENKADLVFPKIEKPFHSK